MRTGNHAPPGTSDPGRPAREMLAPQQIRETIVDRPLGRPQIAWQSPDCGSCSLRIDLTLAPDRKSTRLNSSHTVISYAVFCLKKKKSSSPANATAAVAAGSTHVAH